MLIQVLGRARRAARVIVVCGLFAALAPASTRGASVTLAWDQSTDPAVAGYYVYWGVASRLYTNVFDVGRTTTATLPGLVPGVTYHFAATSYNAAGMESDYCSDLAYTIVAGPATNSWTLWWQNTNRLVSLCAMSSTNMLSAAYLNPAKINQGWQIMGAGDFGGPSHRDLFWQHTDGWVGYWLMNGTNCTQAGLLNPSQVNPGWWMAGVADLFGDGQVDLLWQHTDGRVGYWRMNGTNCAQAMALNPSPVNPGWKIVGVRDLDRDGRTDLLWQHDSGLVAYWLMNGATCRSAALFNPGTVDPAWRIVGPK